MVMKWAREDSSVGTAAASVRSRLLGCVMPVGSFRQRESGDVMWYVHDRKITFRRHKNTQ